MHRILPLALVGLFGLLGVGCGNVELRPDHASGKDFERNGAQQLVLDKLTDDYIDAKLGDNTDWKYLKVPDRGILELVIYWDNKDVPSVIDVRDRFGALLDSRRHSSELDKDQLDLKVEPGTHFVRLNTPEGSSVYTIEAKFQRFDHNPGDDVTPEAIPLTDDLLGENDPLPPVRRRGRRTRGRRTAAPTRRARRGTTALDGTITRVVGGRQKGTLVLTLNLGEGDGLRAKQKGHVLDNLGKPIKGGRFTIKSVGARRSKAVVRLTRGQLATRRSVQVFVE